MVFSSNIFLFLFLPLFLAIYYLAPAKQRNLVILVGSYGFYAWWRVDFLLLFIGLTLWNYWIGLKIVSHLQTSTSTSSGAKPWLTLGVTGDLAVLGYFKYANFGIDNFNTIMLQYGFEPFIAAQIILPIGISFYTFQAISYIIDVYRRDTPPTHNLVDFGAFISLFPQLIAGPVLRYKDLANQFTDRTHSLSLFGLGAQRFMQGFIAKVFIADSIAPIVTTCFSMKNPTTLDAWLGALAYTAQLLFDFSGYSAMAIGLGLMMGFRFIENFNQPYISQSITEFWRRWHISLSSWLKDYLYISLGGNRGGTFKTYRNLFLTMFLGGLWHGANWTFVLWGTWHGVILSIERSLGITGKTNGFSFTGWLLTFLLVVIGWVMFRAPDVSTAFNIYSAMFSLGQPTFSPEVTQTVTRMQLATLLLAYVCILVTGFADSLIKRLGDIGLTVKRLMALMVLPLFLLSLLKLSAQSYSPFLYFQF